MRLIRSTPTQTFHQSPTNTTFYSMSPKPDHPLMAVTSSNLKS